MTIDRYPVEFRPVDHDRLFKQLVRTFFAEFLELFFPDVPGYVEPGSLEFLDKEVFTDLASGSRHEVDLLAKCRFRSETAYFLIHVETQASAQADFAARMFRYFARLTEQHALPVYPIALLTYDAPLRSEPDLFEINFPDLDVLTFRFQTIQLNRLSWRDFVRRPNPVAAALMAKMRIDPVDRPRVKLECLRLLATLKLDRARQALIRDFMDSYLRLNTAEMKVYDQELQTIDPPDREAVMQIVNEWEARGEARGEALGEVRGKAELILAQVRRRFGEFPDSLRSSLSALPADKLQALGETLLDLSSMAEIEAWLAANG